MRRARLKNLAALPKASEADRVVLQDNLPPEMKADYWTHVKSLRPVTTMKHEAVSHELAFPAGSRALKRTGGTYNAGRNAAKRLRRAQQRGQ